MLLHRIMIAAAAVLIVGFLSFMESLISWETGLSLRGDLYESLHARIDATNIGTDSILEATLTALIWSAPELIAVLVLYEAGRRLLARDKPKG